MLVAITVHRTYHVTVASMEEAAELTSLEIEDQGSLQNVDVDTPEAIDAHAE